MIEQIQGNGGMTVADILRLVREGGFGGDLNRAASAIKFRLTPDEAQYLLEAVNRRVELSGSAMDLRRELAFVDRISEKLAVIIREREVGSS